jgi:hypothetical protein
MIYPSLTIVLLLIIGGVMAFDMSSSDALAVSNIDTARLSSLFGGVCTHEWGCETDEDHCDEYTNDCDTAGEHGASCYRCTSDSQKESCHDWGVCIGGSCSSCQIDDDHDCGDKKHGACIFSSKSCGNQIDDGNCGTVTQCTTIGGW